MPTYSFLNTETGEQFDSFMSIAAREDYLNENKHLQTVMTAPAIVSHSGGTLDQKTPDGFKEVLSKVAEAHPTSTVGDRYGKKSIKQVQTEQIVKKHVDKITKKMKA
jgi:hypothetical protein